MLVFSHRFSNSMFGPFPLNGLSLLVALARLPTVNSTLNPKTNRMLVRPTVVTQRFIPVLLCIFSDDYPCST